MVRGCAKFRFSPWFIFGSISSCITEVSSQRPSGRKLWQWELKLKAEFRKQASSSFQKVWQFSDSNCDGSLTSTELSDAAANILGADHMDVYGPWKGACHRYDETDRQFSVVFDFMSELLRAKGLVWWTACKLWFCVRNYGAVMDPRVDELLTDLKEDMTEDRLARLVEMFSNIFDVEKASFQSNLDLDGDGCVSQAEYEAYVENYCFTSLNWNVVHPNGSACRDTAPKYLEILGATLPHGRAHGQGANSELSGDLESYLIKDVSNGSSCVDQVWYSLWSIQFVSKNMESITAALEAAFCHKKGNQTQAVMEQVGLSARDQGAGFLTIVLALIFATCCSFGCVCCTSWYYRKHLRAAHDVHKLLKAKIDTWSLFDTSLEGNMSDIRPSFQHYLGIQDLQLVRLSLLQIVHPNDSKRLRSALDEVIQNPCTNSMPSLASVRLGYGAMSGHLTMDEHQYLPVELLLVRATESSILVGLTALDNIQPQLVGTTDGTLPTIVRERLLPPDDQESAVASCISQRTFIVNGSDVASSVHTDAASFRSMDATKGGQLTKAHNEQMQSSFRAQLASLAPTEPELLTIGVMIPVDSTGLERDTSADTSAGNSADKSANTSRDTSADSVKPSVDASAFRSTRCEL